MDKLVKLLALAGSDNDSEALAAMRAAGRRLKELNLDWNDMALMLGRAAADIIKEREAKKRSEKRARFKASPQGKIATYRRFVREHKKALKSGDEMKAFLWQMRAEKALEDMDPETRERLTQLDRRRERRGLVRAEIGDPIKWGSAA
jgi:pyruvate/2-oxoglutarate dehydrogenase complex dihydrolipoamide acyltransferase (E2) component